MSDTLGQEEKALPPLQLCPLPPPRPLRVKGARIPSVQGGAGQEAKPERTGGPHPRSSPSPDKGRNGNRPCPPSPLHLEILYNVSLGLGVLGILRTGF